MVYNIYQFREWHTGMIITHNIIMHDGHLLKFNIHLACFVSFSSNPCHVHTHTLNGEGKNKHKEMIVGEKLSVK